MNILIVKLGATGDVVRSTPLLHKLSGRITWITAAKNVVLLRGVRENLRAFSWEEREKVRDCAYDLVINLEDDEDTAGFLRTLACKQLFGAHLNSDSRLVYTEDSRQWFDLSLISIHGKARADQLKLQNRRAYQELIFEGLGLQFGGERYVLPEPSQTGLFGDVAIAPEAGPVWPMKNWAYYDQLRSELEQRRLKVNVLPVRATLLEHLGDVRNHRCLVSGDSLPMHLALGSNTKCVTLFTCTSPWEIYDYGLQTKLISPTLEQFFYQRGFDVRATTAIALKPVLEAVLERIQAPEVSVA